MDVYIGVGVRRDKLCSAYPPTSGDQMLPAVRPVGVHLDRCLARSTPTARRRMILGPLWVTAVSVRCFPI